MNEVSIDNLLTGNGQADIITRACTTGRVCGSVEALFQSRAITGVASEVSKAGLESQ